MYLTLSSVTTQENQANWNFSQSHLFLSSKLKYNYKFAGIDLGYVGLNKLPETLDVSYGRALRWRSLPGQNGEPQFNLVSNARVTDR